MNKSITFTLVIGLCLYGLKLSAQTYEEITIKVDSSNLVSNRAFGKKVAKEFNYLILGENSPQQGISAVVNDKKNNIKINGLLYNGAFGTITAEADLAASQGIYFIDEVKGSEQGKVTLNYFKQLRSWSSFKPLDKVTKVSLKLQMIELISVSSRKYLGLKKLMDEITIKSKEEADYKAIVDEGAHNKTVNEIKNLIKTYVDKTNVEITYKNLTSEINEVFDSSDYFFKEDSLGLKMATNKMIQILNSKNVAEEDFDMRYPDGMKLSKIMKDFKTKQDFITKKLQDSINELELETADANWVSNHVLFWGASPFYERQSLKRFTYDGTKTFDKMFATERGDVFGLTATLNYSIQWGKSTNNSYQPRSVLFRLLGGVSRASNLSSFTISTLDATGFIGNDVNGNPVNFTSTDNALIGDAPYEYGFGRRLMFDTYFYPFTLPIGIFGSIGYDHVSFADNKNIDNQELYPMRLGLLFSLTNKDKKNTLVTIQAFVDRTDLNLKPTGDNGDLRFGVGVGVPLNFK